MKALFLTFCALLPWAIGSSQAPTTSPDQAFIEVEGYAEMEVVPDEIYIQFYLKEYEKDKVLQTIEMQENQLTAELKKAGINMREISVSDFESNFVRVDWGKKDYRQEKKYDFKVRTIQEVAKVFETFEALDIRNADINRFDHSERRKFENNMRIDATKNAKTQADEMLVAIGQKVGKALLIKEHSPTQNRMPGVDYNGQMAQLSTLKGGAVVQYKKIKISASVFGRFAIE